MILTMLIASYLLGSVPFGLLLTKMAGVGDIRAIGSGNIGATNVLRTGRKGLAAMTLLLDLLKGVLAVTVLANGAGNWVYAAALAVVLGHNFPVWLRFKGGKGVATTLGVLIGFAPALACFALMTWLASFFLFRISSLSALAAAAMVPVYAFILYDEPMLLLTSGFLSLLLIIRHRSNIQRLLRGQEGASRMMG